jgi:uncharacterized membrane protein SirB2
VTYLLLRHLHTILAAITIAGFLLRGYWMLSGSDNLQWRITRVAPHAVDTAFLLSGIAMLLVISLNPFSQSWLLAKFAGLILYVVFGSIALKRGPTRPIRASALVAAVLAFAYVVGVALSKSPASWIRYLA